MKVAGFSLRLAIAACCWLAVWGQPCWAQIQLGGSMASQHSLRGSWQQRVLGGSRGMTGGRQTQGDFWGTIQTASTMNVPTSEMDAGDPIVHEMGLMPDGGQIGQEVYDVAPGGCASCGVGPACGGCGDPYGGCGNPCGGCGGSWGGCCLGGPWYQHLTLYAGVQGFKGPVDQGINGNFGFHEGVNWSGPVGQCTAVAYQIGFRAVQSDIEGDQVAHPRTEDRDQWFVTAGIFRRAPCGGWQWGVVYDYLSDRYYYGNVDLGQIRSELSWSYGNLWEIGFWGAYGVQDGYGSVPGQNAITLEPTDLFSFFYRQHFGCGGTARLWAGFSGQKDGVIGADLVVPISTTWVLENNFNYLIPNQDSPLGGQTEESWGLGISLVWYPGRDAACELESPYHALFRVADNSVFMVDSH